MSNPKERGTGNQEKEPFGPAKIEELTGQAILGKEKAAHKAYTQLVKGLNSQDDYGLFFDAIASAQSLLLSPQIKTTQQISDTMHFLSRISEDTGTTIAEEGPRYIKITPQLLKTLSEVKQMQERIMRNPMFKRMLPGNFKSVLSVGSVAEEAAKKGMPEYELSFALPVKPGEDLSQRKDKIARHNAWQESFDTFLTSDEFKGAENYSKPERIDTPIELLRNQPEAPMRDSRLFDSVMYAGMSISNIEHMDFPAWDNAPQITEFVTGMLSDNPSVTRINVVNQLFLNSIPYRIPEEEIEYKNKELLKRISSWQQYIVNTIYYEQEQGLEDQTKRFLESLDEKNMFSLLALISLWSTHPTEFDPDYPQDKTLQDNWIYQEAINEYNSHYPNFEESPGFAYGDEIAETYFRTTAIPNLIARLDHFGVGNKYPKVNEEFENLQKVYNFEEEHLDVLRNLFERNCGQYFLERLEERKDEIKEVTQSAWESTFEGDGMNFLPMRDGINQINFSDESIPDIIGVRSLNVKLSGTDQDWTVHVKFDLKATTNLSAIGTLDKSGKLILRAPLEKEIPGLHMLLNQIAVLVFHDLVTQRKKEAKILPPKVIKPEDEVIVVGEPERKVDRQNKKSTKKRLPILPRVQSEKKLIHDAYTHTGYTPRIVELHKTSLRGASEYEECINEYNTAMQDQREQAEIERLAQQVESIGERMYKISEEKKEKPPERFTLKTTTDPITGEERFLQTWVVKHTSPKPTEEELRSPEKLYERYYRKASSIAYLDTMKPWLIGE